MATRHQRLVVIVRLQALLGEIDARREVAGIRRRRDMCHLLALEVGERLVGAVGLDDGIDLVAADAVLVAHAHEGHAAGHVDGEADRARGIEGDMQATRALGLDLRGVRLHVEEDDPLPRAGRHMRHDRFVDRLVDRRVLGRRPGEDQRRRVLLLGGIRGYIGHEVVVRVAVKRVELPAVRTGILRRRGAGEQCGRSRDDDALHGVLPQGFGCCAAGLAAGGAACCRFARASASRFDSAS